MFCVCVCVRVCVCVCVCMVKVARHDVGASNIPSGFLIAWNVGLGNRAECWIVMMRY